MNYSQPIPSVVELSEPDILMSELSSREARNAVRRSATIADSEDRLDLTRDKVRNASYNLLSKVHLVRFSVYDLKFQYVAVR